MPTTPQIGMNLNGDSYLSTEFPFLDRVKSASSWSLLGGNNSDIQLNKDGYPAFIPAGHLVYSMVALDPVSAGTDETYVLTYTGTATFGLNGATVISSTPGKIVFKWNDAQTNLMPMNVYGLDASSPLTAIHIVRQDQESLFESGEIFNPAFTGKISQYSTLRYMDWTSTNASTVANWADRTHMSDMSWQSVGNSSVPLEVMVALANETKTNMWLNVPTQATDDYVRQMMTYVRDHLDPSLSVNLEYSNEVWNFGFQQSGYAAQQGAKLWDKDANGDGVIDPNNPAEHDAANWVEYAGYRAAQVANVAKQVFAGHPDQLHTVLGTQTGWTGLEYYILDGVSRAGLGSVSSLFDDYAIDTYFGGNLSGQNDADRATILSWAKSGDAGVTAAFAAMKDGTGLTGSDSLASLVAVFAYQGSVAAKAGLKLVAYEGGVGLAAYNFAQADQPTVLAFYQKLNADPRMGDLYKQMVSEFSAAGGTLLNAYMDAGPDSAYGTWGTLKSIYDQGSPAWDALIAAEAAARPTGTGGGTTGTGTTSTGGTTTTGSTGSGTVPPVTPPPTGFTANANYTMANGEKTIAYTGSDKFTAIGNDLDDTITAGDGGSKLSGGAGNDVLNGGAGADYLDGGTGADTMIGGAGDDVYIVDNPGDVVVEKANGGTDEVRTSLAGYALGANVENLTYTGTGLFTGTGNALANVLTAGDGGSKLSGGDGDDTLIGGAGNDYLDGGTGNDVMTGGAGNDIYIVDSVGDQVIEQASGGTDEVRTTLASYTLGDNLENLTYTGTGTFTGTGNALANVLTAGDGGSKLYGGAGNDTLNGGAGADYLDGGTGADTMTGGAGNDVYLVDSYGDSVVELAGGGTDEIRTALGTYVLPDQVENLTYTGTGAFQGMGNALNNVITGGSGPDRLLGGAGDDTLVGGAGDDVLVGGPGADTLTGGGGADRFFFAVGDLDANSAKSDTITDFSRAQGDKIDLTGYDANPSTAKRDAFTFIGSAAFGKHAGELRIETRGGNQIVCGDLNGDGIADFTLNVSGSSGKLIASDFVL